MARRLDREQGGFSLVELLVTIFIAGIVFSAMVPLFISAQGKNTADTMRTVSLAIASDRIEKIRDLDYNSITQYKAGVTKAADPIHNVEGTLGNPSSTYNMNGELAPTYRYMTSGSSYRDLYITYTVALQPAGAMGGTEQYKEVTVSVTWDNPDTTTVEPPRPAKTTVLATQIYKQFAGPIIVDFRLLQSGDLVGDTLTSAVVTMRAKIASADVGSMAGGGLVAFSVFNSAGTLVARVPVTTPTADPATYEATWNPASASDGQYNFKVVAYNKDSFQGNSWQLTYVLEKGAPTAPTVTAVAGNATVAVSWITDPPATDIDHYEVWRSATSATSGYIQVVASTTSTSYNDTGLSNGTTYWYQVIAVDTHLNQSSSAPVSATPVLPPQDITGPTAPGGMSAAKGGPNVPTIVVSWTTASVDNPPPPIPSGMNHYVVARASNSAFTTGLSTLDVNYPFGNMNYTDFTAGHSLTWYYRVAGVDLNGNQGPWSAVVGATTDPPVTRTLSVNRQNGKFYVWVQSKAPPYLWYNTNGSSSTTKPAGVYGNKNASTLWSNLPSGLYTVIWSLNASGVPQTGARDADCSAGNVTMSI